VLYGYVQVAMGSCLFPEQRIDAPPPIDPDIDSVLVEESQYLDYVTRGHFGLARVFIHK
jgi:hypothetical protein